MKKISFYAFAMAGMLFAACSADKDVAVVDPQNELPEGYMSLNINLPTTPSVRAVNDSYDDGLDDEYAVNDCALLLFEGESEAGATLLNAQIVFLPGEGDLVGNKTDNITTTYSATAKVKGHTPGAKLWALAMLNYRNVLTSINENGMPTIGGLELNQSSNLANVRLLTTAADLTTSDGINNDYFFMTNAVLSKKPGGAANPENAELIQLAELDPTKIYERQSDATGNPAGEIFVERAVAKATLSVTATEVSLPDETEGLTITSTEWTIDNTEPTSFVVRNPGADLSYLGYTSGYFATGNYRFVGNTTLKAVTTLTESDIYRTYWCYDPQYESPAEGLVGATSFANTGIENPLYCYENTFDLPHQNYKNTTRAIIKVVTNASDFWTVSGVSGRFMRLDDATSYVLQDIITNPEVREAFNDHTKAGVSRNITKDDFKVTYEENRNPTTGQREVKSIELAISAEDMSTYFDENFASAFNAIVSKVVASVNERVVVNQYEGGIMYYENRFKHFAGNAYTEGVPGSDDLAPWNVAKPNDWETAPSGGTTRAAYYSDDDLQKGRQNYLGRYGMVRNNWYDVTVTAFNNIGYPVDPSGQVNNPKFEDPNTPDDNIQEYISAKIHVLSWAKRTQSWGF